MAGRMIGSHGLWAVLVAATLLAVSVGQAVACTNITLQADDGSVVRGRTMEFGANLETELLYIPRGTTFTGYGPDAKQNGLQWTATYAAGGANLLQEDVLLDGLNEEGLSGGILFFPTYAGFQDAAPDQLSKTIAAEQLLTWALTQFATVAEVEAALPSIRVVNPAVPPQQPQPVHYIFTDTSGTSIVVEYVDGQLHVYDNPLGVLTNSPDFSWHLTNLRNYINLSVTDVPPVELDNITVAPLGQGESLHGLPGDFTPPSRFVRAVVFAQAAPKLETGEETVMQAFHIMNQFDIPPGVVPESPGSGATYEQTEWTVAVDLTNRRFYITTADNRDIRLMDLTKLDPNATGIQTFPLDQPQTIVEVGP